MSILDYSSDAENILSYFYRCDVVLYVEGDEDVPFWKVIFDELSGASVEVIPVYGVAEVDKKINKILVSDLKILAARDSDFIRATGQGYQDPRVLYTHGYSIENCLYNASSVFEISFIWCREVRTTKAECEEWFESVFSAVERLVLYDCANHIFQRGMSVIPDNCTKFMVSNKSAEFDFNELQSYINSLRRLFSDDEVSEAERKIAESGANVRSLIRGHFLASLVQKYVSKNTRASNARKSVSFDAIYASAISNLRSTIQRGTEGGFYQETVERAVGALIEN